MFFSVFWTAYIPVTLLILSLLSQGLLSFIAGGGSALPRANAGLEIKAGHDRGLR